VVAVISTGIQAQPVKGEFEKTLDYRKFINPPVEFRSFPFYSINDSLDETEIKNQIYGFAQAGFGGFYLHSRDGLITEFLGEAWWKIMDAAVMKSRETGIRAMFYDEDKWPSGFAGGIIPRMNEAYRAKCLARIRKDVVMPAGSILLKEDSRYKYIQHTAPMGNPLFNGTSYVDLFNPEMVKQFLKVSYLPYIEKYAAKIKGYSFAIFTDEPHIHARYFDKSTPNEGVISYSPWVAKKFREINGYDPLDKIELLFEEKADWREVRLKYYRAAAQQFDESFTQQINNFCKQNGVKFTGHYLGEEGLEKVRDRIGNAMLHYRSMEQPGMDHLGLNIAKQPFTPKCLSSVANQYAIPFRLTELFGISGQNMNFEDRKWIAGWHSILGVNHFCPHLTLYSMKGLRKRDYPPTFSYQQPYWPFNKKIEEYLGRISYAATIGQYTPQVLLINPLESEYMKANGERDFSDDVQNIMGILQNEHYDYDLGDEQIMADTAYVKGNHLVIGAMPYPCVVLPEMISIREKTLDLLVKLQQNGGKILSSGQFPEYMDGKPGGKKLDQLKAVTIRPSQNELAATLRKNISAHLILSGKDASTVWTQVREVKEGNLILFYNTSHTDWASFAVQTGLTGKNPVLWDPATGKNYALQGNQSKEYQLEIAPSGIIWISTGVLSLSANITGPYRLQKESRTIQELKNEWKAKRQDVNAITLDFAAYSTGGGSSFGNPEPVIGIFNRLSKQKYSGELKLKYRVQVDNPPSNCNLVLEQPEMYTAIRVNQKDYQFKTNGFFVDHQFKTSDMSGLLQKGENIIQLQMDFKPPVDTCRTAKIRFGTEIESIYLTGDFAVTAHQTTDKTDSQRNRSGNFKKRPVHQSESFSLTNEKEWVAGDLTTQGYPLYAGAFELKQSFEIAEKSTSKNYFLELPDCESIVSIVELNGTVVDTLCWAPYQADITKVLRKGKNELKITIVNSLRNLLGPHHNIDGELIKVGPGSFTGAGGFPGGQGESDWYDLRQQGKPTKIWRDSYSYIPFGLLEPVRIIEKTDGRIRSWGKGGSQDNQPN
jgi:hypothetical protein